jgi:hypothetical protein
MKLRVTLEIEVSDLPQQEREELADGLNFRAGDDETFATDLEPVPRLDEYTANDLCSLPYEFFEGMDDYEAQRDVWAGSDVYVYFSKITVTDVMAVSPAERQLI